MWVLIAVMTTLSVVIGGLMWQTSALDREIREEERTERAKIDAAINAPERFDFKTAIYAAGELTNGGKLRERALGYIDKTLVSIAFINDDFGGDADKKSIIVRKAKRSEKKLYKRATSDNPKWTKSDMKIAIRYDELNDMLKSKIAKIESAANEIC